MENYNFDLGLTPSPARKRNRWLKLSGIVASITIVAFLLVYSGGMENLLKLLGVGASGIYDVSVSSSAELTGHAGYYADGEQPLMEGVTVFSSFSGTAPDPDLTEKGIGFVAAIFSSPTDLSRETYLEHYYVSAPIDLTLEAPLLSAIEVTEFIPLGSSITYAYRTAAQASTITSEPWQPLDASVRNNTTADGVTTRTAPVELIVERFVQLKATFEAVDPMHRSALYAFSFQYKAGEASEGDGMGVADADAIDRQISVRYSGVNVPTNADIDVLSGNADNQAVYTQKMVDLSEREGSFTFTTALSPGAYALVVSGLTIETQIVPFVVEELSDRVVVNLGVFAPPTGERGSSDYDLNGDGAVNTLDLQLLMSRFTS